MAVVAHHPVIVHLERILVGLLAVDVYLSAAHLQVVALVDADGALVNGYVLHRQAHRSALLRYPYGAIVVPRPAGIGVQRIDVSGNGVGVEGDAFHDVLSPGQRLAGAGCKRHVAVLVKARKVFHAYAEVAHHFVGYRLAQLHVVCVLHIVGFLVGLAVKVDYAVLYLQCLSGQAYAPLHVVLAAVGRSCDYLAVFPRVVQNILAAYGVHLLVPVILLLRR